MILDGKTVIVSGVGPGLGRRVALAAARDGANVVLGARTEANLIDTAEEIDPTGKRVAWAVTDITAHDTCQALADLAVDRFGTVDGLVNCAALDNVFGGLESTAFDELRKVVEVNLVGSLAMTKAALPALKDGGGAVVFINTQSQLVPPPEAPQMAYAASKGGLTSAMYALSHELGRYRIRVNSVAPGWMWGPPVESFVNYQAQATGTRAAEVLAGLVAPMALPDMATDADVAEAVVFFLSDRAKAITGQMLLVNAGHVVR
ncbi:SDR family oxidoreductase [Streptomyces sp. SID3343]|uniref:SDR family oxidoreductase n=1 Tax=Streptomyces sp. SID3343 TaxID=2690260 RepID=UPI00136F61DB|nr:SDR family oxidoreductase [Streptomyces sp. SID3343]MYW06549.1 SDR family oxidoreductase [Streptomyces sp. SID3343]